MKIAYMGKTIFIQAYGLPNITLSRDGAKSIEAGKRL